VSVEVILGIYVFILAIFVGFEVISRVPSVLHTPLMSATNAIHGIVVLGAMLVAGAADTMLLKILGFVAVVFGAANVFGGFVVTDRMLEMFKRREPGDKPNA
jgi:H+-translocating NAD(P) transhydrogenase subunit alpha